MPAIRAIRLRLCMSQTDLGAALECSQANVSQYERGQTIPPAMAARLIACANARGLPITYDHVYGGAPLPHLQRPVPAAASAS